MVNRTMFSTEKGEALVREKASVIDKVKKVTDGIKDLRNSIMRLIKVLLLDKSGSKTPVIDALEKGASNLNEMKNSIESTVSPLNSTGIKYHK